MSSTPSEPTDIEVCAGLFEIAEGSRPKLSFVYRRPRVPRTFRFAQVKHARLAGLGTLLGVGLVGLFLYSGCTTVDPGNNFSIPEETFNEDYFFCHVEPELIFGKRCGSGDPAAGDPSGGCHFNAGAVSGMALVDHPAVDCGGGDHPVSRTLIGAGGPARGNLQAVSLVMSRDYQTAPLFLRPTGHNHPRQIFGENDPVVDVIKEWAQRP